MSNTFYDSAVGWCLLCAVHRLIMMMAMFMGMVIEPVAADYLLRTTNTHIDDSVCLTNTMNDFAAWNLEGGSLPGLVVMCVRSEDLNI